MSLPRADTAVRPYAEFVRVALLRKTIVENARKSVAVGWTY